MLLPVTGNKRDGPHSGATPTGTPAPAARKRRSATTIPRRTSTLAQRRSGQSRPQRSACRCDRWHSRAALHWFHECVTPRTTLCSILRQGGGPGYSNRFNDLKESAGGRNSSMSRATDQADTGPIPEALWPSRRHRSQSRITRLRASSARTQEKAESISRPGSRLCQA
jgi:hypothetical protein